VCCEQIVSSGLVDGSQTLAKSLPIFLLCAASVIMDAVFRKNPRGATVHRVDAGGVSCDWITAYGANTGHALTG
jgi:hypothetical protein